jgi:hypothetical protein
MIYFCCDEGRRQQVRDPNSGLNGIDFVEVVDADAATPALRQRVIEVHFLKPLTAGQLNKDNVLIEGGERISGITVTNATISGNVLTLDVENPKGVFGGNLGPGAGVGDFSVYTLRLVQDARYAHGTGGAGEPPEGFDPVLCAVSFSFKIECPSDFDCRPQPICPPNAIDSPEIDYLAKDFSSFRQLILDRMSVLMPKWQERNAADVGISLIELLAYVGDHLSYQQDVITTEAYLDTARRRSSVRKHALLVDYFMHDGCNARTWVQVQTSADRIVLPRSTQLLTRVPRLKPVINPQADPDSMRQIEAASPDVFETMEDLTLFIAHNEIEFYTWADERCCLPAGETRAALKGKLPDLQPGDVLIFEEILGPLTGQAADADPSHRHAVRLISINREVEHRDGSKSPLIDPLTGQQYVEIEWHSGDALPFAVCISAETESSDFLEKVSVARGNVVLADHGRTITDELLGAPAFADDSLATVAPQTGNHCENHAATRVLPRFHPRLKEQPLTQAAALKKVAQIGSKTSIGRSPNGSAASVFRWEMREVLPAAELADDSGGRWLPQRDLLSSDAFAEEFVAEVEQDGRASLRFGDDQYGQRPAAGVEVRATYRIGNGVRGNIGGESFAHVLTVDSGVSGVRNPMPARGGSDPESIEHVRRVAPSAFRIQERAVTPEDYVEVAQRHHEVQRAAARVRWTGSWRTIFLSVDRLGGRPVDAEFEQDLRIHLERYRLAGHDLEIDAPHFVPLEIEMTVCVKPGYYRGDVRAALLRVFSNTIGPDGSRGLFHPDNFSFGQPVYLSKLYAGAQQVEGVRFVEIRKFQRLGIQRSAALDAGVMEIGNLEIARLDNDPSFVERGVFRLTMEGGR